MSRKTNMMKLEIRGSLVDRLIDLRRGQIKIICICIYAVVAHPTGKWKAQVRFLAVDQQFSYD